MSARLQSSTSIVERLRFDAVRCELHFSKGVASNIEEGAAEIERLRALVKDLADDLEGELRGHYGPVMEYPSEKRRFERDMANVYEARRALLARRSFSEGGEGK